MRPLLLLTRPLPQSERFAHEVQAVCPPHDVLIAPLSEIAAIPFDPAEFTDARGLVLTSANAVPMVSGLPGLAGLPAYCVGPATTQAAQEAGFQAYNSGGDALALIEALKTRHPTGPLVHARGVHLAHDLVAALQADGITIRGVAVYEARGVAWPQGALAALIARKGGIAPLFSPRTARRFVQQLHGARPPHLRPVAISEACAAQLPDDLRAQCVTARSADSGGMVQAIAAVMSQGVPDGLRHARAMDK